MARPRRYNKQLAEQLCDAISSGRSVKSVCNEDWAPDFTLFYRWVREKEEFYQMYTRAREIQSDCFMDDIVEIADDSDDEAHSRRVRVDARRIFAEKCSPRKYGIKQKIENTHKIDTLGEFLKEIDGDRWTPAKK